MAALAVAGSALAFIASAEDRSPDSGVVQISSRIVSGGAREADVTVAIETISESDAPGVEPQRIELAVPGSIQVRPTSPAPWRIRLLSNELWAPDLVVTQPLEEPVPLEIFETAELEVEMSAAEISSLPDRLEASFVSPEHYGPNDRKKVPPGVVPCEVEGPKAVCRVPAGRLDLRFQTTGAAPVYRWGIELDPGQPYDLGKIEWVPGGSVVGFVLDEEGWPEENAEVRLSLPPADRQDPKTAARFQEMAFTVSTNDRGFFQIDGIGPGAYRIEASKSGAALARSPGVVVIRGDLEEKLSDPLVLKAAASLAISLQPPLDPFHAPWTVQLLDPSNPRRKLSGKASETGSWSRQNVDPGNYLLAVLASDDSRWLAQQVGVEPGEQSLVFEIPVVEVAGSVSMGGDPVAGSLALILKEKGSQVDFELGEDGEFSGFLPDEGRFEVQVEVAAQGGALVALEPVEIERKPGQRRVELDVEIPDTRIEGDVFDARGNPVDSASIYLLAPRLAPHSETRSDQDGSFEITGLSPGEISLYARKGSQTSEFQTLQLMEDLSPPRLRLELRELVKVEGLVLSPDGLPLPGASILAFLDRGAAAVGIMRRAATDVEGTFSFEIPQASSIELLIQAPGYGARMLRQQIEPDEPIIISLSDDSGTLVFDLPARELEEDAQPEALMVAHDGVFVSLFSLARFMGQTSVSSQLSGLLEIPQMASGAYTYCRSEPAKLTARQGVPGAEDCQTSYLAPHGVLKFEAP